ncbi:hypothetical protein MBAV_003637 [Candidatus Magnetobacterium bavaricum]|uniref:Uncharacterized protein n=1 Tax=Candidatus Magnetobacterium bavaricum TaxID=29290 RepID=A0A0F3GQI7_9BACT|nr:hypothetical protein MBAV_003637 [Candidatus Magnetobacterium bavaricum]
MIIGRIITQGSRLHLCQWGRGQEIEEVLGIKEYMGCQCSHKLSSDDILTHVTHGELVIL